MDEIKFEVKNVVINKQDLAFLNYVAREALNKGVQVGIPWSANVYKYLFETAYPIDYAKVLGYQNKLI